MRLSAPLPRPLPGNLSVLFMSTLLVSVLSASITEFGAKPDDNSLSTSYANSQAFVKAFAAANASATDRVVEVPAGQTFTVFNQSMSGLVDVTLSIKGKVLFNSNTTAWARYHSGGSYAGFLFTDCHGITINGGGEIDGQGYGFWWEVFLTHVDARPHMVSMEQCTDIEIYNILARNSPQFHFRLEDIANVHIHDMQIHVDVDKQKEILAHHGLLKDGIPVFPLNTDGIDPSGENVLIENVYIENFDDAVAVKPSNGGHIHTCSRNITIRNSRVRFGVGLTIGSVSPNEKVNCVRDILFENIAMETPIKAIYIKTNPGDSGSGVIQNVTYRNITGDTSLWYPIWIGPQQQKQPGTSGTGCSFLYPIVKECPTQPLVDVRDITLDDVHFTGGLTLPGVVLCNATNPCQDITFNNVTNDGLFLVQKSYVCENVIDSAWPGSKPAPVCSTTQ